VWFIHNEKTTDNIAHQFELPVKNSKNVHGQFRQAQLTAAGTVLVAHVDLGKAVEYGEHDRRADGQRGRTKKRARFRRGKQQP
jgi:hypothetical protein